MNLNKQQKGEIYVIVEVILWSFFPIITKLSFNDLSPLYSLAFSTLIALIFFAAILTYQKNWGEVKVKSAWLDIFGASVIIGVIFFSLIFLGIKIVSPNTASILMLMEIFFSMAVLRLWQKEQVSKKLVVGSVLMVAGAIFILFKESFILNFGSLLIISATFVVPFGNHFAKQARQKVSSIFIMAVRSLISVVFLFLLAFFLENPPTIMQLKSSLLFLIINGLIMLGLTKILWLEGINKIPISKAVTFLAISPAFTILFTYLILTELPSFRQIISLLPIILGIYLITGLRNNNLKNI